MSDNWGEVYDPQLWRDLGDNGFLVEASTVLPGCTAPTTFMVGWRRPDVNPITGVQSADFEMEYQRDDCPTLEEGAQVIINHTRTVLGETVTEPVLYVVRAPTQVDVAKGDDGFFRCAYLTRQTPSRY